MGRNTKICNLKHGLAGQPQKKRLTNNNENTLLTFSFRFFKQSEPYFGLSGKQNRWFISLLDRLKDISNKGTDFLLDPVGASGYRLHQINWEQKGIKVCRNDFDWVDKKYLDNPEEFEFMQFEISTGTGRIIGFIDETGSCFNIVAIDAYHNLQPSKIHNWQTQKTQILESEIEYLHSCIARMPLLGKAIEEEHSNLLNFEKYEYCAIESDFFDSFQSLCDKGNIREKFQEFLLNEAANQD